MKRHGEHTIREIRSQTAAWASALQAVDASADHIRTIFDEAAGRPTLLVGCGSPYYLAVSAAALMRAYARMACLAAPASEFVFDSASLLAGAAAPLMVVFSRSGETSEAVAAARLAQRRGGKVLAVGCDSSTTLMRLADLAIEVREGREESATQTRSFAGMFVAAQAIVALLAARQYSSAPLHAALAGLPAFGLEYLAPQRAAIAALATDLSIERIFVLGSGTRYGLACEIALKFQEMSLTAAQAFHTLEFRHGPMSMVDDGALVLGMVGEAAADEEAAVLGEAKGLGARVLAVAEQTGPELAALDHVLVLGSGLPAYARDVLYLPPLQWMAYERAIAKALDPDSPPNVTTYIRRPSIEIIAR